MSYKLILIKLYQFLRVDSFFLEIFLEHSFDSYLERNIVLGLGQGWVRVKLRESEVGELCLGLGFWNKVL